jgi:N-acetylglucosaminyl-diphospho-decaprenol L-rhamnosyltransferase
MKARPQLSIIIINWKSKEFLRECILSIGLEAVETTFEIIVVDNASYDGCREMLGEEFPEVIFVQSEQNLGFSKGNNLGVSYAKGEVLLFLNPDTKVLDRAIDTVYRELARIPDAGLCGARLLNTDGSLQTSCVQAFPTIVNQLVNAEVLRRSFPKAPLWGISALFAQASAPKPVEMVSGAFMMIKRDVFEAAGGFSPEYFMYSEDVDLCYKVKCAGFTNYYVPEARVMHHGGGSSKQARSNFSNLTMRASIKLFLRKSRGPVYSAAYQATTCLSAVSRMFLLVLTLPVWIARGDFAGWEASFRKWWAIFRWGLNLESSRRLVEQVQTGAASSTTPRLSS